VRRAEMKKLAWVLALALVFTSCQEADAFSNPFKKDKSQQTEMSYEGIPFKYRIYENFDAVVMRVVDGDTIYVRINDVPAIMGYEIGIRVYGIDTRELDDGGNKSKEYAKTLLKPGDKVKLTNTRRGKYFRIVADVIMADGQSLAEILLEKDLAYPYYGGTKRPKGWKPSEFVRDDGAE